MAILVMKFGGTSVGDLDRIRNVALHVKREVEAGHQCAVVVSAMAGHTNQLVEWTKQASPMHDAREYDAVVASGEQVTSGLLAIVLQSIGVPARSWQGWQIPIKTDNAHGVARIAEIQAAELRERHGPRRGCSHCRLSGHQPQRAHYDTGPWRLRYQRRCRRGCSAGRSLRYIHGCGRRVYDRPADCS